MRVIDCVVKGEKGMRGYRGFTGPAGEPGSPGLPGIKVCSKYSHYLFYSVSQKNPPLMTCGNFSKTVENFSAKFYMPIVRSYLR